eukprot:TRINITY_DN10281_c0_g1_i4.p1 TRINITY_DN10281_c0_g1~~TRINITY_DN10281_c0_g1_i4.p1  ORF type:complete len:255 (+),score=60.46 TRINITY_DN10281_c0_g1_i4:69-767(+)
MAATGTAAASCDSGYSSDSADSSDVSLLQTVVGQPAIPIDGVTRAEMKDPPRLFQRNKMKIVGDADGDAEPVSRIQQDPDSKIDKAEKEIKVTVDSKPSPLESRGKGSQKEEQANAATDLPPSTDRKVHVRRQKNSSSSKSNIHSPADPDLVSPMATSTASIGDAMEALKAEVARHVAEAESSFDSNTAAIASTDSVGDDLVAGTVVDAVTTAMKHLQKIAAESQKKRVDDS